MYRHSTLYTLNSLEVLFVKYTSVFSKKLVGSVNLERTLNFSLNAEIARSYWGKSTKIEDLFYWQLRMQTILLLNF